MSLKRQLTVVRDRRIARNHAKRKAKREEEFDVYLKALVNKPPYQPKFLRDKYGNAIRNPKYKAAT